MRLEDNGPEEGDDVRLSNHYQHLRYCRIELSGIAAMPGPPMGSYLGFHK